jgi:hypothetical protein
MLDRGCDIDSSVIIWAALGGEVDGVRLLHSRGVPLWDSASEEDAQDREARDPAGEMLLRDHDYLLRKSTFAIAQLPQDSEYMRKVLHYGWAKGAPLTPAMEEVLKAKRAATRATLLCFHVTTGLSQAAGASRRHRPPGLAWSACQPSLSRKSLSMESARLLTRFAAACTGSAP